MEVRLRLPVVRDSALPTERYAHISSPSDAIRGTLVVRFPSYPEHYKLETLSGRKKVFLSSTLSLQLL